MGLRSRIGTAFCGQKHVALRVIKGAIAGYCAYRDLHRCHFARACGARPNLQSCFPPPNCAATNILAQRGRAERNHPEQPPTSPFLKDAKTEYAKLRLSEPKNPVELLCPSC